MEGHEELTEERMGSLVRVTLVTLPNIGKRPWLATPEEDLQPFIHELTIYCRNHDIDPSEYIGDWLPLVVTGAAVGAGIVERHREHKRDVRKGLLEASGKSKDFDSTTGYSEKYTPVEDKKSKYDATVGGDNLPQEEEHTEEDIDEDEERYSIEATTDSTETDAAEDPESEESSV